MPEAWKIHPVSLGFWLPSPGKWQFGDMIVRIPVDGVHASGDSGPLSNVEPIVEQREFRWLVLIVAIVAAAGCAHQSYFQTHESRLPETSVSAAATAPSGDARRLPMFAGYDGRALRWSDVMDAATWADIVIIGEQHDDALGHAVELAAVQDVLARVREKKAGSAALSMEMLERDEQPLADDYLDGVIDQPTFAKLTFSENWAGEGSWIKWYQPLIDAARDSKACVIAANAPRRYVRLARTDGYVKLEALPESRQKFFDLPRGTPSAQYRKRFEDVMREASEQAKIAAATMPATSPDQAVSQAAHGGEITPQRIDAGLRTQLIWDATMGASIVNALRGGAKKVIHIVGQFHCDFEGGTVQQIRKRMPHAKILVISMQRDDGASLREEDIGRADVVIYTGKPDEAAGPSAN